MATINSQAIKSKDRLETAQERVGTLGALDNQLSKYSTALEVDFDTKQYSNHKVRWKNYPDDIPTTFKDPANQQEHNIIWFNNFEIVDANDRPVKIKYKVTFTKPPTGRRLCVYNAKNRQQNNGLEEIPIPAGSGNNFTVDLELDDPPTGMFP